MLDADNCQIYLTPEFTKNSEEKKIAYDNGFFQQRKTARLNVT